MRQALKTSAMSLSPYNGREKYEHLSTPSEFSNPKGQKMCLGIWGISLWICRTHLADNSLGKAMPLPKVNNR